MDFVLVANRLFGDEVRWSSNTEGRPEVNDGRAGVSSWSSADASSSTIEEVVMGVLVSLPRSTPSLLLWWWMCMVLKLAISRNLLVAACREGRWL